MVQRYKLLPEVWPEKRGEAVKICDRVFDRVFNWLDAKPGMWSAYAMITLVVLAIPFALVEGLIRLGWRTVRKAVRKLVRRYGGMA